MSKDYQEVEKFIEAFFTIQDEHGYSVDVAASGGDLNNKEYVRKLLTPKLLELISSLTEAHKVEMEKVLLAYQMSLEAGNVADVITDIKNRIIINKANIEVK
jgi:hypothetical protein